MGKPELFYCVHSVARLRHLSLGAERAYSDWVSRFILFRQKRRPKEVGAYGLVAGLLYGSGLRLMEAHNLQA